MNRKEPAFAHMMAMLSACMDPASLVQEDAAMFQQQYPNQIVTVQDHATQLRYAWSGQPHLRPLIFVHGSPGSWEGWAHFLLDKELQSKFQVIAVDRPGYGGSQPGVTERSISKQAQAVLLSLQKNTSDLPAILVGHSFGGPVIAKMAIDYPNKVSGLIFVASSVDPQFEKMQWVQYPATWWPFRQFIPSKLRVCNEEIMALKAELSEMLNQWKDIKSKTVTIHGEDDPLVPVGNVNFLNDHLNKNTVLKTYRIPGLNHFVPWRRPDLIFRGIKDLAVENL